MQEHEEYTSIIINSNRGLLQHKSNRRKEKKKNKTKKTRQQIIQGATPLSGIHKLSLMYIIIIIISL